MQSILKTIVNGYEISAVNTGSRTVVSVESPEGKPMILSRCGIHGVTLPAEETFDIKPAHASRMDADELQEHMLELANAVATIERFEEILRLVG